MSKIIYDSTVTPVVDKLSEVGDMRLLKRIVPLLEKIDERDTFVAALNNDNTVEIAQFYYKKDFYGNDYQISVNIKVN